MHIRVKKLYSLLLLLGLCAAGASAQTLAQAKALYEQGEYEKAKPAFKKLAKNQPANGNYQLWYGVCCLKTGDAAEARPYLETAVKKRIPSGQLYLGQAYNALYRFEDAIDTYEKYIADLAKRKRSTEEAEVLLEKSRANLRMLKGVERVCVIDSFVVDKEEFLEAYKISPESGKLHTYQEYFGDTGKQGGTVYETELGDKAYYSEMQADGKLSILSSNKLQDGWSQGALLPESINGNVNADYPYVATDGVTIYYASDGPEAIGGYDIFVTRYNTNTDSYLTPENVGMPFNSPYNDYMYVVDEFNNLGWFASDRYQPEGKVCVYVFIPNTSKQVYNYEGMERAEIIRLAQLHAIRETWQDRELAEEAREKLAEVIAAQPDEETEKPDFAFVLDDQNTYHRLEDFRSPQAKSLYEQYAALESNYKRQTKKLKDMREQYAGADKNGKRQMAPSITDTEKWLLQLSKEIEQTAIEIRRLEKQQRK